MKITEFHSSTGSVTGEEENGRTMSVRLDGKAPIDAIKCLIAANEESIMRLTERNKFLERMAAEIEN